MGSKSLDGVVVDVEVDTTNGLPGMDIVGLPDAAVKESRERVIAAIKYAGLSYPRKRWSSAWSPPKHKLKF
jgi:magnesium chelatase family protein